MIQVDLAVLADAANLSQEGKLNILGEFNILLSNTAPWTMVGRSLVLRLTGNAGDVGPHTIGFRILDSDRQLVWTSADGRFDFASAMIPGTPARGVVVTELPPILMHTDGTHEFEILLDGEVVESIDLHCVRRQDMPGRAEG